MKQEVIQDFLTVPGIAGIALIDGLSRPYFHGFGAHFDASQQNAIAQGIQQVLETTPDGFNSFEFQFDFYRIYLHKLKRGITLLVLTGNTLPQATYTQAVRQVLLELQLDREDPITAFQAIAAQIPLVWQPVLPTPNPKSVPESDPSAADLPNYPLKNLHNTRTETLQVVPLRQQPTLPSNPAIALPQEQSKPTQVPPAAQPLDLPTDMKDVLAAVNALNQLTTQYLGTLVVTNYWKSTRPAIDWLNHFQIERSTQMTFSVQNPSQPLPSLTPEQHRWLQEWISAFMERCSKVIRDFAKITQQSLTEQQKAILFQPPRSVD